VAIVALTAHSEYPYLARCRSVGMDDFLSKPIDADRLFAVIENIFSANRVRASQLDADAQILDRIVLDKLDRLVGRQKSSTLVADFVADSRRRRHQVVQLIQGGDIEGLQRIGYTMKGSANLFGLRRLAAVGEALARVCRDRDARTAIEQARKLCDAIDQGLAALDEHYRSAGLEA
jgi:CheY-like chemotaxis protein